MTDEMAVRCAMCREMGYPDCEHDQLPFTYESAPTVNVTTRRCRRHEWKRWQSGDPTGTSTAPPTYREWTECARCGAVRDEAAK